MITIVVLARIREGSSTTVWLDDTPGTPYHYL
jgi:hypothetical protein